jgi:hypothetical protein
VRLVGVTGIDDSGIAVIHGSAHTEAERYVLRDGAITRVTPDGRAVSPILEEPLTEDTRFSYHHEEAEIRVECDVRVASTSERETITNVSLEGCIALVRTCRYPAGAPFPTETTHTRDETYCPGVGLVRERSVFRPPPTRSAIPADRSERVVGFRVEGGPPPPRDGCARYIVLPNDVAAACGPDVRAAEGSTGTDLGSGGCAYRYALGTAELEVVVGAPNAALPESTLARVSHEGRAAWVAGPPAGCPGAERMAPLLSSLLR